jgi:integrase
MAAQLAREGVPMNAIQAQLGHTSLATTSPIWMILNPAVDRGNEESEVELR